MKNFVNRKAYSQKASVWICPEHGVVDFDKGEASIMGGEPFCTKKDNGKMCCQDLTIVLTFKECSKRGNLSFKTKKELEAEIRKIIKESKKKKRREN